MGRRRYARLLDALALDKALAYLVYSVEKLLKWQFFLYLKDVSGCGPDITIATQI